MNVETIRLLVECVRNMDKGITPYVLNHGCRLAVQDNIMKELGLENGQVVSDFLVVKILKAACASNEANKIMKLSNDGK